jgi:hypothetical protein
VMDRTTIVISPTANGPAGSTTISATASGSSTTTVIAPGVAVASAGTVGPGRVTATEMTSGETPEPASA